MKLWKFHTFREVHPAIWGRFSYLQLASTCATYTLNSLESCQIICWVQFKTYMTHVWVSNLGELRLSLWVLFSKLQSDCFDDMTKKHHLDRPFLLMDYWVINYLWISTKRICTLDLFFSIWDLISQRQLEKKINDSLDLKWFKSLITNNLIDFFSQFALSLIISQRQLVIRNDLSIQTEQMLGR